MKCPICKDVTLVMSSRQNIEIDFCPECRGVWLDRGELDKIIELSLQSQPAQETSQYHRQQEKVRRQDHYHDERRPEKPYRKRNFLMDLFD